MVYVVNKNGKPLMPCTNVIGRLLLKQGKAKVKRREPFTIKLTYQTTEFVQPVTLGVDTGSDKLAAAAVDNNGNVLYKSEVQVRNDVHRKMEQRKMYRRTRRNRKTRYREARFLNRKNSIKMNRFSSTMSSKLHSHVKEIEFVKSILPITNIVIETASFDMHAMKNPDVLENSELYQKGDTYGYQNIKQYVYARDGHTCQHCHGKSKDNRLEAHHIIFRSMGGSDAPWNLITLCHTCHTQLHDGKFAIVGKVPYKALNHATQMNSIRVQLLKRYPQAIETFGYITKIDREAIGLSKEHYNDAVAIANLLNKQRTGCVSINDKIKSIYLKKCIADGDYQQTKGARSEKTVNTKKIGGFRKFDKVKYRGKEYFIKGRMSTGYAILMNIEGEKANLKPIPKFNKLKRIQARKSLIMCVG